MRRLSRLLRGLGGPRIRLLGWPSASKVFRTRRHTSDRACGGSRPLRVTVTADYERYICYMRSDLHNLPFGLFRSRFFPLIHLNFLACREDGRDGILGSVLRGIRPLTPSADLYYSSGDTPGDSMGEPSAKFYRGRDTPRSETSGADRKTAKPGRWRRKTKNGKLRAIFRSAAEEAAQQATRQ